MGKLITQAAAARDDMELMAGAWDQRAAIT